MKIIFNILFLLSLFAGKAQNNVFLFSADGRPFKVFVHDSARDKHFQGQVQLLNVMTDTLQLDIVYESGEKFPVQVFLFDKRKKTSNKDFEYLLILKNKKLVPQFMTMRESSPLPSPLVPAKPIVDTSEKWKKNAVLGHLCELKNGKIIFFNNLPASGHCTEPMPPEYLGYIAALMSRAQVSDEKYDLADQVTMNNCINTDQLNVLLGYVDYEIEKLRLVRSAYNNLTDTANRGNLKKSFRFESSQHELNSFFKGTGARRTKMSHQCTEPSPSGDLQKFTDQLADYNNDGQRIEHVRKNYKLYCYPVSQVQFILQKFIHDREKLEAAKLLYYYCSDPQNYRLLKDEFSYKLSGSELQDFIDRQKR